MLGAYRAGIKTIVLPKQNKEDLEKIPKAAKNKLKFVLIDSVEEALKVALES